MIAPASVATRLVTPILHAAPDQPMDLVMARRWWSRSGAVIVAAIVAAAVGCGAPAEVTSTGDAAGAWQMLPASPLSVRSDAAAIWTGREVLIYGGSDQRADEPAEEASSSAGGSVAPTTVVARTEPAVSIPPGPPGPTVSTPLPAPTRMASAKVDGAAYDPATSTWRSLPAAPIPEGYTPQ